MKRAFPVADGALDLIQSVNEKPLAMLNTKIAGMGYYVPEQVVTNFDLEKVMDTTGAYRYCRTALWQERGRNLFHHGRKSCRDRY